MLVQGQIEKGHWVYVLDGKMQGRVGQLTGSVRFYSLKGKFVSTTQVSFDSGVKKSYHLLQSLRTATLDECNREEMGKNQA